LFLEDEFMSLLESANERVKMDLTRRDLTRRGRVRGGRGRRRERGRDREERDECGVSMRRATTGEEE
jgi:hypothetical protein